MRKLLLLIQILYFSFTASAQLNWTNSVAQPPFAGRFACTSFVVNGKGYVIGGCDNAAYNGPFLTDVWEYDFAADTWTMKNPYPGGQIYHPVEFVIGNYAYVGMGFTSAYNCSSDFYKYDPSNDTWSPIATYPGVPRYDVLEFTLNGEGYVGTGSIGGPPYLSDFYKYNPGSNTWTQTADFPSTQPKRSGGSAFSYNGIGYAGFGQYDSGSGVYMSDFYAYDPVANSWTQKASAPNGRDDSHFIEVCQKFYLISGVDGSGNASSDVDEYDPSTNVWTTLANGPFPARWFGFTFTYNNVGYLGTGKNTSIVYNDFWKTTSNSTTTASFTSQPENCKLDVDFTNTSSINSKILQWTFQNGNPQISTQQSPSVTFPGPGTYKVTLIDSGAGCTSNFDTTVQLIQVTDSFGKIPITPNPPVVCAGNSVMLSAPAGPTYLWFPASSLSCNSCANPIASPTVTTTYTVTEIGSKNCFTDTSLVVAVSSGPTISSFSYAPENCKLKIDFVDKSSNDPNSWQWSFQNGIPSTSVQQNPSVVFLYSGTYKVTLIVHGVCGNKYDTSTQFIQVSDSIGNISISPDSLLICLGSSITLNAQSGPIYYWSPNAALSCSSCPNPVASPTITTTYTVLEIDSKSCFIDTNLVVTVLPDSATASFSEYYESCGLKVNFNNTSPGNSKIWQWVFQSGTPPTSTEENPAVTFPSPGNYKTILIVYGKCSNYDTSVQLIRVTDSIGKIPIPPDSLMICRGNSFQLNSPAGSNYFWYPDSLSSCNNCTNPAVSPTITTTYSVTEIGTKTCFTDTDFVVTVLPAPIINLQSVYPLPCNNGVMLNNEGQGQGLLSYHWYPPSELSNDTISNPIANPTKTTTYTLIVSDGHCSSNAQTVVDVGAGIVAIPNAFSPNNDGNNDTYFPFFLCPVKLEYFRIYDRWGEEIFETSYQGQGWDGTYKRQNCSVGVYVYVVKGTQESDGAAFFLKGNVTLFK